MEYIAYYEEIVSRRESCRNFKSEAVEESVINELKEYYAGEERLLPDIPTEVEVYSQSEFEAVGSAAGYNGFLIAAPQYLVIYSGEGEHALENAGFIGQGITLKMTQLNLAACWLTVNDAAAVKAALKSDKAGSVAAVIAFGYRDKDEVSSRIDIRTPSDVTVTKSSKKAAPKVTLDTMLYSKKYGRSMDTDALPTDLLDALRSVCHAQSFYNRQPYRVIVDDDLVTLVGLPDELTGSSDRCLNYGIVMFNFYAVLSSVRAGQSMWTFGAPDRDLDLPADCEAIATCRI